MFFFGFEVILSISESEILLEVFVVAEILKFTPQYVLKLINSGKLPVQDFGERMTRMKEGDLKK
jgi:hypothetical protein